MSNRSHDARILAVGGIFVAFYCAILLRSYQLQILGNAKLNSLVESQYTAKLVIQPKRGTIYDRNGEVLAMDVMVASIGAHPHLIPDGEKPAVASALAKHTGVPENKVREKLASGKRFVWIERRIPLERGEAVAAMENQGIQVVHEFRRYYPNRELAGPLLGAVGYDAKALGGLELAYDHYLKSESQLTQAERDARGKLFTPMNDADANYDLVLTVDKNIQYMTEAALRENAVKHNVKSGFAIVADVRTGEILAMANYPGFNPNSYWAYPQDFWKNHAVIDTFEPGSTFKTVLMGAALNSGKVRPSDKFNCEGGALRIGKHTIHDHGGYGLMTAQQILQVSSNIGVTKVAFKIGKKEFADFMSSLGFGRRTDIGLAGESAGFVRGYATWKDIEFSNIAFGQGVSVTGLQMVSAYAAFANGGRQMKPFLVRRIEGAGNKAFEQEPVVRAQVMSESAAKDLRDMLFTVTQPGGTARIAHIDGYYAAGKTGTAQKVDPKLKAYARGEFVSSFIGFAPLEEPRIAVYVVYDTPRKNGYYGGVAAAPVFKKVARDALAYLGVAPSREPPKVYFADAKNKPTVAAKKAVAKLPPVAPKKARADAALVAAELADKRMPDLRGWSYRELLEFSRSQNVALDVSGSGFVAEQFPAAGKAFANRWKIALAGAEALRAEAPMRDCAKAAAQTKKNALPGPKCAGTAGREAKSR